MPIVYLLSMNVWYVCMMYICIHTIHMTVDRYVCRKIFVKNRCIYRQFKQVTTSQFTLYTFITTTDHTAVCCKILAQL